jgi:hypothetical protein
MKKLLICLALATLAINLQAVENVTCAEKAKVGCSEKAKTACAEKTQAKNCAEKAQTCSEKKNCCSQSQVVLSPKAAEQAGR